MSSSNSIYTFPATRPIHSSSWPCSMVVEQMGTGFRLPGFKSHLSIFTGHILQILTRGDLMLSSMECDDASKGNNMHLAFFCEDLMR